MVKTVLRIVITLSRLNLTDKNRDFHSIIRLSIHLEQKVLCFDNWL